ncbi:MAG: AbrB/MazE/SpoVT family DNA-binding domain-containing protein [Oscillospiraceae bacterium]
MKSTGIVRKIDQMGRIVLPKELRKTFNINIDSELEIFVDDDKIILMKHEPTCLFCKQSDSLKVVKGKLICDKCLKDLKEV